MPPAEARWNPSRINWAESYFAVAAPELWGLFIASTLCLPCGIVGTLTRLRLPRRAPPQPAEAAAQLETGHA